MTIVENFTTWTEIVTSVTYIRGRNGRHSTTNWATLLGKLGDTTFIT